MHSNVHFSFGVLIASIAHKFLATDTVWDLVCFLIIIISAIIADIDVFLSKFARDNDHRNFFTHSIYPSIILLCAGTPLAIFWGINVVWLSGLGYGSHILLDTIDWNVRLFFGKKQYGFAYLINEDERNLGKTRKQLQLNSGMDPTSFSTYRYFHNLGILVVGITLSLVSFLVLFVFASQYWYVFIGYFGLLEIYLYQKKKMEEKYEDYEEPDTL